jgi:hypothetical protein
VVRVALALLAAGVLVGIRPAGSGAVAARECGIPDAAPLWVDFAAHDAPVPQKPGLVLAYASGTEVPAAARAAGAATVFFDLNFNNRMGTPSRPADPATIVERADRLFDYAVSITGCTTPWIAENELFGAQTPTPWTATTAQYRANVLAYVRRLAERGARPFVTIANPPYTGDEAAQWWRDLATSAVLIRQVFFTSPNVGGLHARGPLLASRAMRKTMRTLVGRFTEIGIPADRVALELQFHSALGQGGREGLQPSWKWFDVVKLEALAARQVTKELGTHSIWSWGWATFSAAGADPDKANAVCVYLWARDPALCDGPKAAGPSFDASTASGQLALPPGVVCELPEGRIETTGVAALARALGDRDAAASVLLERLVLRSAVELEPRTQRTAERLFVADRFGGNTAAYLRAIAAARLSRAAMRAVIEDDLRRQAVAARFMVAQPGGAAVESFYASYAGFRARLVAVSEPVGWLGERKRGYAIETFAPRTVFGLSRARTMATAAGPLQVRPLDATVRLGSLQLSEVRTAIQVALRRQSRATAYDNWLVRREKQVLAGATCVGDDLPQAAAVDVLALPPLER